MSDSRPFHVLLLGGSGQVGRAIQHLMPRHWVVEAPSSREVSLCDPVALEAHVERRAPALIVNCAAYTRVDDAETDEGAAALVNREAPAAMARASSRCGARLVHLSTDYVFDGTAAPYQADARTAPLNAYGRTKRDGEVLVLKHAAGASIIRTAWVHSGSGTSFVATATRLLARGTSMKVVDDQIGTPTAAETVAEAVIRVAADPEITGIQHVTDTGVASWYDVACCVADALRRTGHLPIGAEVTAVSSEAFPRPAKRPRLSILDTHATRDRLRWEPPHWRHGVIRSTEQCLSLLHSDRSPHV
ncbi:dTDP-4-dehydrorhamnose reductase [Gemmatimonas sp.]|uniref:dTDP-4-dehydrorhamnose reductase n=1 Tax=Gemmatimonas sp. TaxID=1962908 RepID=UPI0022C6FF32|nr:dTDP-4-dehydrorhamnose reductase [Gemmatimonas sp.]MCZ8204109.1 dTDP-4-dehydrorhamnose reductase [Gemmatimonas sp.]